MRFHLATLPAFMLMSLVYAEFSTAQTRDQKVLNDRAQLSKDDVWYYDDLDSAIITARKENKPLMIVLRCIP